MTCQLFAVCFEASQPLRLARFWADVLGREVVEDAGGVLLPGGHTQLGLRFVPGRGGSVPPPARMHLHLTSASAADQQHTVATALSLGAGHLDVGQRPEEGHIVLADPEGNAFCVIEPGNSFLAGCGFLGEVACDGTREVGLFWSAALGWPLVWDQDQETAIQSPRGGTKVAWGGPPVPPKEGRSRQRFELLAPVNEIDRLASLGATRLEAGEDGTVVLADPDGNEFCVSAPRSAPGGEDVAVNSSSDHRYLLDNAQAEAGERFVALAELFDGVTRGHFDRLGWGRDGAAGRWGPEVAASPRRSPRPSDRPGTSWRRTSTRRGWTRTGRTRYAGTTSSRIRHRIRGRSTWCTPGSSWSMCPTAHERWPRW